MSPGRRSRPTSTPVDASDEEILAALVALTRRQESGLLQFRSLVGAYQYRLLYRLFRRWVSPGSAVLDWGAGNGHFSYFLVRAGYRATGFSFQPFDFDSWIGEASYRFVAGSPADPVALPFADATFDAVASVGVLEHVRETGGDEATSLTEIARILVPGGIFLAYHFPNRTSWIDFVASRVPGKHHHVWRYTRAAIEELARGAGLELVETGRYAMLPRSSVHRLLGRLAGRRAVVEVWEATDAALGALLPWWCQNHYFVARKGVASGV